MSATTHSNMLLLTETAEAASGNEENPNKKAQNDLRLGFCNALQQHVPAELCPYCFITANDVHWQATAEGVERQQHHCLNS